MTERDRQYPAEFLGFWIHRLRTAMQSRLDEHAAELGLSATEALLMTMLRFKGPSSLVDISQMMGLAHPSVLRHIDALEERKLVERTPHPHDRRIKLVELTDTGHQLEQKINRMLQHLNQMALGDMDSGEVNQFFDLIRRAILSIGGEQWMPPPQTIPPDRRFPFPEDNPANPTGEGRK